jgi:hypothetical protein
VIRAAWLIGAALSRMQRNGPTFSRKSIAGQGSRPQVDRPVGLLSQISPGFGTD